jgi:hypothetical protein
VGGFDSAITLSADRKTTTFRYNPIKKPGSGRSTMTVKVGGDAGLGAHKITIKGAGGGKTHTTTVVLTVVKWWVFGEAPAKQTSRLFSGRTV